MCCRSTGVSAAFLLLFLSVGFYNTYIFLGIAPRLDSFLSSRTVSEEVAQLVGDIYRNEAIAGDVYFIHGGLRLGSRG